MEKNVISSGNSTQVKLGPVDSKVQKYFSSWSTRGTLNGNTRIFSVFLYIVKSHDKFWKLSNCHSFFNYGVADFSKNYITTNYTQDHVECQTAQEECS